MVKLHLSRPSEIIMEAFKNMITNTHAHMHTQSLMVKLHLSRPSEITMEAIQIMIQDTRAVSLSQQGIIHTCMHTYIHTYIHTYMHASMLTKQSKS